MTIDIRIGDAVSFGRPEGCTVAPDDRQQKIETIGGVVVEDYGHIEAGDSMNFTVRFASDNFEKVKAYWQDRILVDFTDEAGKIYKDVRVVIKSYSYVERFEDYYTVTLEIWRV